MAFCNNSLRGIAEDIEDKASTIIGVFLQNGSKLKILERQLPSDDYTRRQAVGNLIQKQSELSLQLPSSLEFVDQIKQGDLGPIKIAKVTAYFYHVNQHNKQVKQILSSLPINYFESLKTDQIIGIAIVGGMLAVGAWFFYQAYSDKGYTGKKKSPITSKNPPNGIEIYDKILAIEARKGNIGDYPKTKFRHDYGKTKSKVFGLPDGSISIRSMSGKRLWNYF